VQVAAVAALGWAVAGEGILKTLRPLGGLLTPLRGTTSAFSEALGYARANGAGLGTVLKDVGSYAGGQALNGIKKLAKAIGPELGIAAAGYVISEVVSTLSTMANAGDAAAEEVDQLDESLGQIDGNAARIEATASAVDDLRAKLRAAREEADPTGADLTANLGNPFALGELTAGYKDAAASVDIYKNKIADLEEQQAATAESAERISHIMGISSEQVVVLADKYGVDLTQGAGAAYAALLTAEGAVDGVSGATETASVTADVFAAQMQDVADTADAARQQTDHVQAVARRPDRRAR
jgi:plasmid maintenance system antidote protein VapI